MDLSIKPPSFHVPQCKQEVVKYDNLDRVEPLQKDLGLTEFVIRGLYN